jgi:hypothetical protein
MEWFPTPIAASRKTRENIPPLAPRASNGRETEAWLGIDGTRLTDYFRGLGVRLSGVEEARVVEGILA